MKIVNTDTIPEESHSSPKGKFACSWRGVSIALGSEEATSDARKRHPFDVEIARIPPGKCNYPFHSHSAQWEFYHVLVGTGRVRHAEGESPIGPGDAFVFSPGEAHQLINDGNEDLVVYVIADNPVGESCHYPDSGKWLVRSPEARILRSENLAYYDGEE
ncbi:MAG: cupin domain-containing protein [Puniceicoccaceae bacterium]|nr:MAG: cupin domain-containing protein [Puniceicoccaceae bacterium]